MHMASGFIWPHSACMYLISPFWTLQLKQFNLVSSPNSYLQ